MQYGLALSAWSQIENRLGWLFSALCNLSSGPNGMGSALFYSGRSFASRADLLDAAIRANTTAPEFQKALFRAILKKARQFSAARNRIAHGFPSTLVGVGPYQGPKIREGDEIWLSDGIDLKMLHIAADNFLELRGLIDKIPGATSASDEAQFSQYRLQVQKLPSDAFLPS